MKALAAVALAGVGLLTGGLRGDPAPSPADQRLSAAVDNAGEAITKTAILKGEGQDAADEKLAALAGVWDSASRDPEMLHAAQRRAIRAIELTERDAKGAAQVSQIANEYSVRLAVVQVAQNQRIIELLEQMAKPKP